VIESPNGMIFLTPGPQIPVIARAEAAKARSGPLEHRIASWPRIKISLSKEVRL
jgi:hypothetical protein